MSTTPKLKRFAEVVSAYKQPILSVVTVVVLLFLASLIPYTPLIALFEFVNPYMWVFSNLFIAYIGIVLIIFVAAYYVLFNPRLTTGGLYVFRFAVSLIGVIGLVYVGIFLNPTSGATWMEYPGDLLWWRPTVRTVIYGYVAFTITNLTRLIFIRKFRPQKLRTAADLSLIQPRRE